MNVIQNYISSSQTYILLHKALEKLAYKGMG